MIIFDLDGTLADCEHRRHFIDPSKNEWYAPNYVYMKLWAHIKTGKIFKPDYQSFYEACDKDEPIIPVINIFYDILERRNFDEIEIWSGRSESVRDKTEKWLMDNSLPLAIKLKMRPIGNTEPDEILKERWLDEYLDSMYPRLEIPTKDGEVLHRKSPVEFVFDDRPKVIRMWRRRGIFVFNCCQHDEEF